MIITGTSRGIGRYLAEYYLARNRQVAGCSRQGVNIGNYHHFMLDVCDEMAVRNMVNTVDRLQDGIDILINNAGTASMNPVVLTPTKVANYIFQTNFIGTFLFCREVAKKMLRDKRGKIINFSSVAVPLGIEGEAVYAASKSAVETFTRILAKELSPSNITVNCVAPAPVETDLIKNVSQDKIGKITDRLAGKKLSTYEEIASTIDYFINSNVTGQIIYLGGV